MVWKRDMSAEEAAGVIERFLTDRCTYPQEWNDVVERRQSKKEIESYR